MCARTPTSTMMVIAISPIGCTKISFFVISSRLWLTSLTPPSPPKFSTVDSIFSRSSVKAPEMGREDLLGLPLRKVADEGGPAAAACG